MSDMDEIRKELSAIRQLLDEIKTQLGASTGAGAAGGSTPVVVPVGTFTLVPRDRLSLMSDDILSHAKRQGAEFVIVAPAQVADHPNRRS
jgi:hypothetical protein